MIDRPGPGKDAEAHRTIGEVAEDLHVPQHVLRFWETRFPEIKPLKRAGGRRFYRPEDIALLRAVQTLLYAEGYTIKGVQRLLGEFGARHVAESLARSTLAPLATARDAAGEMPPADPAATAADRRVAASGPDPAEVPDRAGPGAAGAMSALPPAAVATLQGVLTELTECRRLISTALSTKD